jgi:predicted kinase
VRVSPSAATHLVRPLLVIVSGAPGSGKTTLATALAEELQLPLLARDTLKEAIADALEPGEDGAAGVSPSDSAAIGRAAYAIVFAVTDRLLDAGVGVIVESNFRRGFSEVWLEPRVAKGTAVLVHCEASRELIVERFVGRAGSPGRHRVHPDLDRLGVLREELAAGRFEPLELDAVVIRVDTSSGYRPPLPEILATIRRVVPSARL